VSAKLRTKRLENTEFSISGTIEREYKSTGSVTYSNDKTEKKCETTWGNKAQIQISAQYKWAGWELSFNYSYKKEWGTGKSDGCPFGL
jgi:hypothetical protein